MLGELVARIEPGPKRLVWIVAPDRSVYESIPYRENGRMLTPDQLAHRILEVCRRHEIS